MNYFSLHKTADTLLDSANSNENDEECAYIYLTRFLDLLSVIEQFEVDKTYYHAKYKNSSELALCKLNKLRRSLCVRYKYVFETATSKERETDTESVSDEFKVLDIKKGNNEGGVFVINICLLVYGFVQIIINLCNPRNPYDSIQNI